VREQKGIDVLFANAGLLTAAPDREISEEHLTRCSTIQRQGAAVTVAEAPLGRCALKGRGSIILNRIARRRPKGWKRAASTADSNGGRVRSFAAVWTTDLRHRQEIRVNVIRPAPIEHAYLPQGRS